MAFSRRRPRPSPSRGSPGFRTPRIWSPWPASPGYGSPTVRSTQPSTTPTPVVLPGSKNAVDDLLALREAGFDDRLRGFEGPVVGLCGGYQAIGERIENAGVESTREIESVAGIGLLPVETRFSRAKRVERVCQEVEGIGPIAGASGAVTGYEIHMGRSEPTEPVAAPIGPESAAIDRVLGTYLHGLFENPSVREAFVDRVLESAGKPRPPREERGDRSPYERAADLVADHVDLAGLDPVL